jgi:hypothetical protein
MRVYFDGREIGSLRRPGRIALSPEDPDFTMELATLNELERGPLPAPRRTATSTSRFAN